MDSIFTIAGKTIFAISIAIIGIGHFMNSSLMSALLPEFLHAVALPVVYLAGAFLFIVSASIIINRFTKWACVLLCIYLLLVILFSDIPAISSHDPIMSQFAISMAIKDTAFMGATLFFAGNSNS